ncbi:MAG TPA: menaquinone-dependent protoporphyrinogen IX dehydrogenase [Gammaproteobacteria bacterium]|nr:menaquinone-dependent protoporphyrinogen IX dehydrogenase [Gammaproteobacteria bacterium]
MTRILIAYSTVDGHTRTICEVLANHLNAAGNRTTVTGIPDLDAAALDSFDKVVVGASIRYGKYRPDLEAFVVNCAAQLNRMPSAFFTVNLVARKPGRDTPETNPYVGSILRKTAWKPKAVAVFAGKLDYPRYRLPDRLIIQFIMWLTGGPTNPATVRDFTDWANVQDFAYRIARL